MGPIIFRFLLFLGSYAPAFGVLAVLFWNRERSWAIGALVLAGVGASALLVWLYVLRGSVNTETHTVIECRRNDAEVMTYMMSYLVPFVGGVLEGGEVLGALLLFTAMIGLLYANSNMVYINPLLNFFGYRLYEAKLGSNTYVLLTRRVVLADEDVTVVVIGDEILLEVR